MCHVNMYPRGQYSISGPKIHNMMTKAIYPCDGYVAKSLKCTGKGLCNTHNRKYGFA